MKSEKQIVSIKLHTIIDDQGEIENNSVEETGEFYSRGDFDVLIYDEELAEDAKVRNLITIQPNKTTIKRTGVVDMKQTFLEGKMTESHYQHPHGKFHMETYTDSFRYDSMKDSGKGKLIITYTVKLNGMQERKHKLELTFQKEDEA